MFVRRTETNCFSPDRVAPGRFTHSNYVTELDGLSYEEIAAIMDCRSARYVHEFSVREAIDNKSSTAYQALTIAGYWKKVLGMQKEKLSALMDGETLDSELLNELSHSPEKCKRHGELPSHP